MYKAHARCLIHLMALSTGLLLITNSWAHGESLRCPGKVINGAASPSEAAEISSLWIDLGDGANGSDGPLGCALEPAAVVTDAGWSGIEQKFQRGAILIGRGGSAGTKLAAVRGLEGWTIWWNGPGPLTAVSDSPPMENDPKILAARAFTTPASWSHGGFFQVIPPQPFSSETFVSGTFALWTCQRKICAALEEPSHEVRSYWQRITPWIGPAGRVFDARLDESGLSIPDPEPARRQARIAALFPNWLPCFTKGPAGDPPMGEDTLARIAVMMRRAAPCALTGASPRATADQLLAALEIPEDQYPGTSVDDFPCERKGELDVGIVQLIRIVLRYQSVLRGSTVDHVRDILQPWGGRPRPYPYVTPNGSCLGFGIIESENHILLQESGRFLVNTLLAPRGLGGSYDNSENTDWLIRFFQQIARRDFYEFNAIPYTRYQTKALFALHDHAEPRVATAARGLLDWLFAKTAISGNLDRDHRPFRRRPEPPLYAGLEWWSHATTATTSEAAVFAGSLQHVHKDIDLQLNGGLDEAGIRAPIDLLDYPDLGGCS